MPQTTTGLRQINTVMVPVTDLERALGFYLEALGLEKRADVPYGDGERWVEVGPPGGETSMALVPERGEWRAARMTGISLASDDIDATHARLREAGVDVDADVIRIDGPPPPMFWLRDADGNSLLVVEA